MFTKGFYANCHRCLKPGGILATQNGVPFIQAEELTASATAFKDLFKYPRFCFAAVPTYMGGVMAFGCASDSTDAGAIPLETLRARQQQLALDLSYYSAEVHLGAFAMPPYLQALMP